MATVMEEKGALETTVSVSSTSTSHSIRRATSRNGHPYETSGADTYAPHTTNALPDMPTYPEASVVWQPSRVWQDTSDDVLNLTGIQRYIIEVGGLIFKYRLRIVSCRSGTFRFLDSDRPLPDHYDLTVNMVDRVHYVDYNSDNPAISAVQVL